MPISVDSLDRVSLEALRIVEELLSDLPEARRQAVADAITEAMREYGGECAEDVERHYEL